MQSTSRETILDCFQPSQWSTTAAAQMQVSGRGGHPTVSNKWWIKYRVLGFERGYVFHLQLQSFSNSAPQTLSNIVKAVSETENMMLVLDWGDIPMYTKIYYTLSNLSMEDIPVYITMYIIHF